MGRTTSLESVDLSGISLLATALSQSPLNQGKALRGTRCSPPPAKHLLKEGLVGGRVLRLVPEAAW